MQRQLRSGNELAASGRGGGRRNRAGGRYGMEGGEGRVMEGSE